MVSSLTITALISLSLCPLVHQASGACPADWVTGLDTCYKFVSEHKTWNQAQGWCADFGGNLAALETQAEIEWMRGYRSRTPTLRDYAWIGGYKKPAGTWHWKGLEFDTPMKVSDWIEGQPDNLRGEQGCVMLVAQANWVAPKDYYKFDDAPCNGVGSVPFICEQPSK